MLKTSPDWKLETCSLRACCSIARTEMWRQISSTNLKSVVGGIHDRRVWNLGSLNYYQNWCGPSNRRVSPRLQQRLYIENRRPLRLIYLTYMRRRYQCETKRQILLRLCVTVDALRFVP